VGEHLDLFFVVAGVVFAGFGAAMWRRTRRLQRHGQRVGGIVEALRWSSSSDSSSLTAYPVLRFRTADGRDLVVESDVGANPCPVRQGQPVTVVYDPANPEVVRPEQMLRTGTLLAGLFVVMGATAALVAGFASASHYL
jgi:hypothetical protein